jgi:uncharacterized protein YhaN
VRTRSGAAEELSRIAGVIVELCQGRRSDAEIRKVRSDVEKLGGVYCDIESRLQSGIQEMTSSAEVKKELRSSSDIGNAMCSHICNDIRELSKVRKEIKELGKARVAIAGLSKGITDFVAEVGHRGSPAGCVEDDGAAVFGGSTGPKFEDNESYSAELAEAARAPRSETVRNAERSACREDSTRSSPEGTDASLMQAGGEGSFAGTTLTKEADEQFIDCWSRTWSTTS